MSRDLLIEIGLEEVPARFLPEAIAQFKEKMIRFLENARISHGAVKSFATPRRFALLISEVAEKQEDLLEEIKGPAKKIAVDEKGNWTKAALGFAKGKGGRVENLFFKEVKGEEVLFLRREERGIETRAILPEVASVIRGLSFPKNMKWGREELRFVRPIRWLLFLYGNDVIPLELAGVKSNRFSYGHRFLGGKVEIREPAEYEGKLRASYCIVDPEEREKMILEGLRKLEEEHRWHIPLDRELLQEVVHLVEYPTPLYGSFNPSFLQIPKEVLITTMKEHQRYFHVEGDHGELLPYFVTVRNGNDVGLELVRKGNEKVLSARLADARFFYEEDQKLSIDEALKKLEHVVYHDELGTIADKVRRIRELSGEWAEILKLNEETVEKIDRAALISKFDLVTHMVYEFPELQGRMGQVYALLQGEGEEVAQAIFDHYLPRFAGDALPSGDVGALVALADKIDTLVGSFAIGIIPSGSQDPYGLRRAAQGVVQILVDRAYPLTLEQMFDSSIHIYRQTSKLRFDEEALKKELRNFFHLRLRNLLQEEGIRHDVAEAILGAPVGKLRRMVNKAKLLEEKMKEAAFKAVVESIIRVHHLALKAEKKEIDPSLFMEESEKRLWEGFLQLESRVKAAEEREEDEEILDSFATLKESIDQFFTDVMVMVEEEKVRNNRLALLALLSSLFYRFADFEKLVF
ncbi:Glycine--tRNA ligase beta subunit [[Clostridium] ultunense Esp]|nr:Glycine--tRNA ligase beta subunit [[Clostridium] ultunense Esp]